MSKSVKYYLKLSTLLNTIYVLCFFIYIKKLPIEAETQPFILFFLGLVVVFLYRVKLSFIDQFLLLHLVTLSLYFVVQFSLHQTGIVAYFTYLVGPVVYFSFKNNIQFISLKTTKYITIMFVCLAVIIQFQIPILYDVVKWLYSLIISRPGWIEGGGIRGFSLIAPEPSYFAFPAVLLLVVFDIFHAKGRRVLYYKIALFLLIIASKSALVFAYIFIYIFFYYLGNKPFNLLKKISEKRLLIFGGILLILLASVFLLESRVSQVFENISTYFSKEGGFKKLLIQEESGLFRFVINSFAFLSVEEVPLGWGIGEFQHNYRVIADQFSSYISDMWTFKVAFRENTPIKAQTYFANLIADIGIFSIWGFIFVFLSVLKNTGNNIKRGLQWLVLLMLIFVQAQISNPIPWILLAIVNSYQITKEKESVEQT